MRSGRARHWDSRIRKLNKKTHAMWIIRLALKRPYTFVVAALLLLLVTPFVLIRTPTDVLPEINIPVVSIIWNFTGLSAKDIEQRMVYTEERVLTTTVNDIQHIESTSYDGIVLSRYFFSRALRSQRPSRKLPLFRKRSYDSYHPERRRL